MVFWPNPQGPTHHRSEQFREWYAEARARLHQLWDLPEHEWTILLLPLSGSMAIESLIRTFGGAVNVVTDGAFSERVRSVHGDSRASRTFGVLYETNDSRWNDIEGVDFVDAVSALPYAEFPKTAQAVVTVSSKQFGGETVWSVVAVRTTLLDNARPLPGYLDLRRYLDFGRRNETPCTPPIEGLESFVQALRVVDAPALRSRCDFRWTVLAKTIRQLGGEMIGASPVATFILPEEALAGVPTDWLWRPPQQDGRRQAFLWSGTARHFARLLCALHGKGDES